MNDLIHLDAFNLVCGAMLGQGIHRKVFECPLRLDLVVKVEWEPEWRYFSNVSEMKFWDAANDQVKHWLAPCEFLSPDGRLLLQRRVRPLSPGDVLPDSLPMFLCDVKRANFGWLDDTSKAAAPRLVCVDYALTYTTASTKLVKVNWR